MHTVAGTEANKVLHAHRSEGPSLFPRLPVLPDLPTISKVSCGWNHTLALSAEGHVVTWGCNSFHQLGLEGVEGKTSACSPCELELSEFGGERVVDVAAGLRHSLAVTS